MIDSLEELSLSNKLTLSSSQDMITDLRKRKNHVNNLNEGIACEEKRIIDCLSDMKKKKKRT
jgi:hypothetical protein